MKKFFISLLLIPFVFSSCSFLSKIDSGRAVSAGTNAVTAMTVTDAQIAQISREFVAKMDKENNVAPANNPYVQRLNKITAKFKNIGELNPNFKVYISSTVNAFASGDGSVRVYSGLMDKMSDDEVFAVIAHELGHVKHKHTKERVRNAYLTVAAQQAIGSVNQTAGAISDGMIGQIASVLANSAYSRAQELEADETSVKYCVSNNVDPYAMYKSLLVLQSLHKSSDNSIAASVSQMFSSHPSTKKRAAKAKALADKYTGK